MSSTPTVRLPDFVATAAPYEIPIAIGSDRLRRPGLLSLACADLLVTLIALLGADHVRLTLGFGAPLGPIDSFVTLPMMALFGAVWAATAFRMGLYERPRFWDWEASLRAAVTAGFVADSVIAAALYVSFRDLSRLLFVYFVVVHLLGLLLVRGAFYMAERMSGTPFCGGGRVVLIGSGRHVDRVAGLIEGPGSSAEIVGRLPATHASPGGSRALLDELSEMLRFTEADEVVIADPDMKREDLLNWVLELRRRPVHITLVPDFAELITSQATFEDFRGVPLIGLHEPAIRGGKWVLKRGFDVVMASVLLLALAPVCALVALVIWLESGRPVLFRQDRIGLGGTVFHMIKFRTMDVGADGRRDEVSRRSDDGRLIHKQPDDPRVTRVGQVLRRTGLDELPQLVHVLSGKMSLVGPRPELPEIVAEYQPWQFRRFAVPPGITGWWQVNRDHGVPMHFQTELDVHYLIHYSFLLDVEILVRTIAVLVRGRGAY